MLTEETIKAILKLQEIYPVKRSALIPALHLAQAEKGYLSRETQNEVAALFAIEPNEVYAVVTFYDMFYEKPMGKHLLHVCTNVSCMLRGSDQLLDNLCQKLKVKAGETTLDGEFTVIESECLAACDKAPMMLADEKFLGPIKNEELDQILADIKKEPGHPSPVTIAEVLNE